MDYNVHIGVEVMVIYVDVLILVNFYVDYLLLLATEKLCRIKSGFLRRTLAALTASLFSLTIFLPESPYIITFLIKALCVELTVLVAFGIRSLRQHISLALCFLAATYSFAGIMLALNSFLHADGVAINNSSVYIDISPLILIGITTLCYLMICIYRRFVSKGNRSVRCIKLEIEVAANSVIIDALIDTGNSLTDVVSDMPLIVISSHIARSLIPNLSNDDILSFSEIIQKLKGFRLLPYSAVGARGVLAAFVPDKVILHDDKLYSFQRALIAISPNELKNGCEAIVSPEFLERKGEAECF